MSPRSRGAKRITDAIALTSRNHVCRSCLQRGYASAATAAAEAPPITQLSPSGPEAAPLPQPTFTIKAGVVLSRPPLITPDPHPFETAYHLYQRRLNERLVLPFTQYFYYRRSTPSFEHWRTKRRERGGAAARDIGNYNAYSPEAWNDEVLVGDDTASPSKIVEQLIAEEGRADEFTGNGDPRFAGLKRTTEADEKDDQKSLERRLSRTLYLLVKAKGTGEERELWKFPSGPVVGFEGLKEAAQRVLFSSLGPNMNTFFVGHHPVGHYVAQFSSPRSSLYPPLPHQNRNPTTEKSKANESTPLQQDLAQTERMVNGEKTFFMKARIMAGQADLSHAAKEAEKRKPKETKDQGVMKIEEIEDFKWLSKDEVEQVVHPDYWIRIKNMLVAQ